MDITLSNKQIQQIADMTAKLVLRRIKGERRSEPVLVSVRDAARILGVSVNHMRTLKDEYPHIRRGKTKQGHIYFIKEALTAAVTKTQTDNYKINNV